MSKSAKPTYKRWDKKEDEKLKYLVSSFGSDWMKIATSLPGRTESQCRHRWEHVLNPLRKTGLWSQEEDQKLTDLVNQNGPVKWSEIAKKIEGRSGKQCRERWHNHLNPNLNKSPWTTEEENIIIEAHKQYGSQWAKIARLLKGRSDNGIKNHFNSTLRKRVESNMNTSTALPPEITSCQSFENMDFDIDLKLESDQRCIQELAFPMPTPRPNSVIEDIESIPPLESIPVDQLEQSFCSPCSSSSSANQLFPVENVFLDEVPPSIECTVIPPRVLAPVHNQQKRLSLSDKTDIKRMKPHENFQHLPGSVACQASENKKLSSPMTELGCENIMWDVTSVLNAIAPVDIPVQQQVPDLLSFPAVSETTMAADVPVISSVNSLANINDCMSWRELESILSFNDTEDLSRFPARRWEGKEVLDKENVCPSVNIDCLEPSIMHLMPSDCLSVANHFYT